MSETAKVFQNIDLGLRKKERFTINGNEDKFIELNIGDVGISARFADAIPKINEWVEKVETLAFGEDEESNEQFSKGFKEADKAIRDILNEVFDYDVCSVCVGNQGSMFDLVDGEFTFEIILETLFGLYEDTITEESKKLQKRIKSHTDKYIPQDRKRKS